MIAPILLTAHNPGPMTGAGNNTYVLAGAAGLAVLIDAGVGDPRHRADLSRALSANHARLSDVIVTHGHADHASGAASIRADHPGARFWKRPWTGQDEQFAVPWQSIDEGDAIAIAGDDRLVVLHTPGHSPDHLALWHEPSRTLFTGDLVVQGSSVMIHTSKGGNLAQYMKSLERLLSLAPRVLLPAHGPRVDNPAALLSGYLEHRRLRERQVIESLRAGHPTVEAIAESIYHGLEPPLMSAARENVRAHLDKLASERVAREDSPGQWALNSGSDHHG